jgi:hypothetical protein
MFTEEDMINAHQVKPIFSGEDNDLTLISLAIEDAGAAQGEATTLTPAIVVVLSLTLLLAAPRGTTMKFLETAMNFVTQSKSSAKKSPETNSIEQGKVNIDAKNSNVQNVNVINNGGQVNVTSK